MSQSRAAGAPVSDAAAVTQSASGAGRLAEPGASQTRPSPPGGACRQVGRQLPASVLSPLAVPEHRARPTSRPAGVQRARSSPAGKESRRESRPVTAALFRAVPGALVRPQVSIGGRSYRQDSQEADRTPPLPVPAADVRPRGAMG